MTMLQKLRTLLTKKDFFLIIGTGRSGTSLLAGMLDYHSGLQVGFERYAVSYLKGHDLPAAKSKLLSERIGNFKRGCVRERAQSSKYWGNKITTEQIAALEDCATWPAYLDEFLAEVIGKRKVVFIIREGRSCVRSKMNRTNRSYDEVLANYKSSVRILEYFRAGGLDMLECRYEDLVSNPQAELQRVCSHLGVKYEATMLAGSANRKMTSDYQYAEIRPARENQQFPEHWIRDMKQELIKTGYLPSA